MQNFLVNIYIVFIALLGLVAGALWTIYFTDVANIGYLQPMIPTFGLIVMVYGLIVLKPNHS